MPTLREWMTTCEDDTRRILGSGAANRLRAWRCYQSDEEIISFVQRIIRSPENRANGFEIHYQKGVSLEAIVSIHLSAQFTQDDIDVARATLGIG